MCVTHIVRLVLEFILNACTRTEVSVVSMVHGYIYNHLDLHFKYNQGDTSVRTIKLILRYYQADNQADSSADNQADTPNISSELIIRLIIRLIVE